MDSNDRNDRPESRDPSNESDEAGNRQQVDLPSATIIGANIVGTNTATFPGGIVAPAAELAAEEAKENDLDEVNWDALEQFGSKHEGTGDDGVSANQSELEAGEMNG